MQAFTAPCSLHHSFRANCPQPASQKDSTRRAILPASSPIPPITGLLVTGGAKVGRLLLGCAQASTPVREGFHETLTLGHAQYHDQSFVSKQYFSLISFQTPTGCHKETSIFNQYATCAPATLRQSTIPNTNEDTFACDRGFNADEVNKRNSMTTVDFVCTAMTPIISAPGTPPELTESRSSKSSSYGSNFSAENDLSTEITNFEDIGLEDDDKIDTQRNRPHSQSHSHITGQRDTYHVRQRTLPDISYQQKKRTTDGMPRSALTGNMKRGFTSPSPTIFAGDNSRPRSVSPPKRIPRSNSTYSINVEGSTVGSSPRSSFPPSRRGSWQPQRKTIKEIEAEYHDSDDELPEDANLWNVPISPLHSTEVSPRSSFRASSDQRPSPKTLQPIPLELTQSAPETQPRASFSQPVTHQRLTLRSSLTNLSRSNPTSPRMPTHIRNGRTKSWNLAMADLSPEARVVSENLGWHAETQKSREQESEKSRPEMSHRSSALNAIQLPPIQRGTLDFMPISKEKEAVLSRTRPSWLPPKDPKEEERHLKEYQRMMAASIEAEKKKESKLRAVQSQTESTRLSLNRIWDFYINPTTDVNIIDRRIYDLCWHGIPSRIRGKVWQRAVGNPLGLTGKTYSKALERAKLVKSKNASDLSQLERMLTSWFADIDRDAETAFPESGFFQRHGPFWQDLVNICEAYTCYRSDIGYFYGLQLIGALILLQIPQPNEAFLFLANCLNTPISSAFHTSDTASTQRTYGRVVSNLGIKFPRLHGYLFEPVERGGLGLTGQEVLEPMFKTLFANGLDFDRLCRVWDIWIFEGDRTLIRTAVAILGGLQTQIFEVSGDLHLKRRNVQEMLGWGPFNRSKRGSSWRLEALGNNEAFVNEIDAAGKLDYTGR